jgi:hypothetical protein
MTLMVNQLNGFGATADTGAPKVLTYQTSAADDSNLTTYTFSAQAIGTAAADRYVHVFGGGSNDTSAVSSVTIGGVTATINKTQTGTSCTTFIATALVPTGTTADIVIVWGGAQVRCGIGVWSSTGLTSATALDTAGTTTDAATMTLTNSVSGGFAIAGAWANLATSLTWTGSPSPTEDFDATSGESGTRSGCHVATTGASQTIIPDWASAVQNAACAAAF